MDETLRNELGIEKRVVASEFLEVPRQTVEGLCDVITSVFREKDKPVRMLYIKGQGLIVEKMVPESQVEEGSFTPWQMVRQQAEIQIIESGSSPEAVLCQAAMLLAEKSHEVTLIISRSRDQVDSWFKIGKVDVILRVPFFEDTDTPENFLAICGSQSGKMIYQIEYAVICRMT
jgi:hypothetical protein